MRFELLYWISGLSVALFGVLALFYEFPKSRRDMALIPVVCGILATSLLSLLTQSIASQKAEHEAGIKYNVLVSKLNEINPSTLTVVMTNEYHSGNDDLPEISRGMFSVNPKLVLAITPSSQIISKMAKNNYNLWSYKVLAESPKSIFATSIKEKIQNSEYIAEDGGRDWKQTTTFTGFVGDISQLRSRDILSNAQIDVVLTSDPDAAWWGAYTVTQHKDVELVTSYHNKSIKRNSFSSYYTLPDMSDYPYYYLYYLDRPIKIDVFINNEKIYTSTGYPAYIAEQNSKAAGAPKTDFTRLVAKFPIGTSSINNKIPAIKAEPVRKIFWAWILVCIIALCAVASVRIIWGRS